MSGLWDTFMKRLDEAGKLDEFCKLDADDVDGWLEANGLGLTVDQLVKALPKHQLSDDELDDVAGGKFVIYSVMDELRKRI